MSPRATLGYDNETSRKVIIFDELTPKQCDTCYEVMVLNGKSEVHDERARAGAHLTHSDWTNGHAIVTLYNNDNNEFIRMFSEMLDLAIPTYEYED